MRLELRREKPLKGELRLPPDRHQAFHALFLALLAPGRTLLRGWQSTPEWENVRGWLAGLGAEASLDSEGLVVGPPIDLRERPAFSLDPFLPPVVGAGFLSLCAGFSRDAAPVEVSYPPQLADWLLPWREHLREAGWTSRLEEREGFHVLRFAGRTAPLRDLVCRHPRARSAWTLAALASREGLRFQEPSGAADPFEDSLPMFGLEVAVERETGLSPEEEEMRRRVERMRGASRKLARRAVPSVQFLSPADVRLRGDLDLAGWCAATACLRRGTDALLQDVTLPASRSGLFNCLRRMGADVDVVRRSESRGVVSGDVRIRHGRLVGRKFDAQDVPGLPGFAAILSAAAVAAEAETVLSGLSELRAEKDDRLAALADGLRTFGVAVGLFPDGLVLRGEEQPGSESADARSFPDVALALHALGSSTPGRTSLVGAGHLPVSWPHLQRVLSSEEG